MTTQITIRGVDEQLRRALEAEAGARDLSLNRCILALLRQATGQSARDNRRSARFHDLDALAGTWSEAEAVEFDTSLREQRAIDMELWP